MRDGPLWFSSGSAVVLPLAAGLSPTTVSLFISGKPIASHLSLSSGSVIHREGFAQIFSLLLLRSALVLSSVLVFRWPIWCFFGRIRGGPPENDSILCPSFYYTFFSFSVVMGKMEISFFSPARFGGLIWLCHSFLVGLICNVMLLIPIL